MYLKIGGRLRPYNEARAAISYQPIFDIKKRLIQVEETWDISGVIVLQEDPTQRKMTLALQQLESDFNQDRPDLRFIEDNGVTPSHFKLLRADCIDGPRVINAEFPDPPTDVYATGVTYGVRMMGTKMVLKGDTIMEFTETLANPSGGEVRGYVGGAINYAELQTFRQNEPFRYIQSGSAVGLYGWPNPPGPIWPAAMLRRNKPVKISPRNTGPINTHYEIQWEYEFGSVFPLIGDPHEVIGS